jgi:cell division protein FtsW
MDRWLLGSAGPLVVLGLVMVASASVAIGDQLTGNSLHFFFRQLLFSAIGLLLALMAMKTPLAHLEKMAPLMLIAAPCLLLLVFLPGVGHSVNGATRWINLGVSKFQVAEAAKLMMVLYVASYLCRHYEKLGQNILQPLKPILLAGGLSALLLIQPDYGSAVLICTVTAGMVFLAGARWRHLLSLAAVGIPVMAAMAVAEPYRLRRLTSFRDPWADPFQDGFQLTQALIAIGRGEWLGVGLGGSVQKLSYLPEAHNDFIFSVIAEELGFIGVIVILALFSALGWRVLLLGQRAMQQNQRFAAFLAYGIALWLMLQAWISIGVNMGVLPTKGLTLPFISSGGSSLMVMWLALGLLMRVAYEVHVGEPARSRGGRR